MTMQIRELELQLLEYQQRLEQAESEIKLLKHPPDRIWMSPADVEKYSGGKYRAKMVREKIQQAIDYPADTPFHVGAHYTIDLNDRGRSILVNFPEFDRLMIAQMRSIAFG